MGNVVARPSPAQLAWQSYEVGAMITWNLQTFCVPRGPYSTSQQCQSGPLYIPTLDYVHNLTLPLLDVGAWLDASASFGAKYIVLVADHMAGFTLWPTRVHNVSIAATKWKGGQGDVLRDYFDACGPRGMACGFFYSTHYNWVLGVNDYAVGWPRVYGGPPLTESQYEDAVLAQLQELAAYTSGSKSKSKGESGGAAAVSSSSLSPSTSSSSSSSSSSVPASFELWFDGGVNTVLTPRVGPLVRSLFPDSVCHSCSNFTQSGPGGDGNGYGLRWMGNEEGNMPLPSWGAYNPTSSPFNGDPEAPYFIAPSCDTVLIEHFWFYQPEMDTTPVRSTCTLVNVYLTSVGRSSNLILNLAPNTTGALGQRDVVAYGAMGAAVECLWASPLGEVANVTLSQASNGTAVVQWPQPLPPTSPSQGLWNLSLHLMEDMAGTGQRVGQWEVDVCIAPSAEDGSDCAGTWVPLISAPAATAMTGVGHKRILQGVVRAPASTSSMSSGGATPQITALRFTAVTAYTWMGQEADMVLSRVALYDWSGASECVPAGCELVAY